jgi:hypothetical protein
MDYLLDKLDRVRGQNRSAPAELAEA